MNIVEAIDAMDRGEKVRHESFGDGHYCSKVGLGYWLDGNRVLPLDMTSVAQVKLLREGWSIVREQFDFQEAVNRLQLGKRVRRAKWPTHRHIYNLNHAVILTDAIANDWEES